MTTLICDIDGCTHEEDTAKRGWQLMGGHRKRDHGLGAGANKDYPPRKLGEEEEPAGDVPRETSREQRAAVETVPRSATKRGGLRERVRSWGRKKGTTASPGRERAPKRVIPRGRRVPLDKDISDVWGFFGRRLEATPHYPTGRMLQYQAPAAGVIVDKAVAGTLLDRSVIQPLARSRDKYEDVAFLLAGPLITFSITRTAQALQMATEQGDQEQAGALQRRLEMEMEGFDWLLQMMLPRLVEGKKIADEKKAREDAMVAEAFPELAETGHSPAEALRDMLFAPPTYVPPQPQPQGDSREREAGSPVGNGHQPHTVADAGSAQRSAEPAP